MSAIFESPYFLFVLLGMLIFFGLPLFLLIRMVDKLSSYFMHLEEEIKRILNQS